ncbi:MAG: dihydroxy-acid dehydratase [Alphaproteobacteria bacterium]|nr:dihydroxy-acid dehydratase [Alphaproteobacteria bacterium]
MTKQRGFKGRLTAYGDPGFSFYLRKAFAKSMGYTDEELGRPVIGIANTFSDLVSCQGTAPQLVQAVKRGVVAAGGLPLEFPTISLGEPFLTPSSMLLRNLLSMDTEEMVRRQPIDVVVLIGGCDKIVPAQLMAVASADIPAIMVVTGPMMTGSYRGERLGACTDCRRFWSEHRGGRIDAAEIDTISGNLCPTAGTCMVMGTASTMACVTEALGMMLPGGAAIPAVYSDRMRHAQESGVRAVALAKEELTPSKIMTPKAFTNALRVLLAIGGSTNGIVHLTAMARRRGIALDFEAFDRMSRETPVLVDLKPNGLHYMEDLYRAGGLLPVLRELKPLLHLDCLTVTGRTLGEEIEAGRPPFKQDIVRPRSNPIYAEGGLAVLRGSLAPDGAIIKQSAATPRLLKHEGRAVVFNSLDDIVARLDDDSLNITPDDVLVLQNAGPKGAPGMPEAGYLPIPKRLARDGVKDMVRISDARMSGTAFGTVVLHISPEAASGGPLALVKTNDRIRLDVEARRIDLLVEADELGRRREAWRPPAAHEGAERGYLRLYLEHVQQAHQGADFDFLSATAMTATTPVWP